MKENASDVASPAIRPMLSPPAVAQRLGVDRHKVVHWIDSGELAAINVAATGAAKPRWRVDQTDLQAFLVKRRSAGPAQKPQRQKRPKLPSGFAAYFGTDK